MRDNRWNQAQKYEKNWWNNQKKQITLDFYKSFAIELTNELNGIITIQSQTKILEIGSGAAGIITFLASEYKYAIDPLEYFYSSIESFTKDRDPKVNYLTAMGEDLPYENEMFDLIIIDNVLDHCSDPLKVIEEMQRVLKSKGIIYFRQNTYHFWGVFIRGLMEKIKFDKGHPFTFSKKQLKKLTSQHNFKTLKYSHNGYLSTWKKEFFSFKFKELAKALLFATRDKTLYILQKE